MILAILLVPTKAAGRDVIAVIDTGVDLKDPEVKAAMCGGEDFTGKGLQDAHGHGTRMFLTIARGVDLTRFCLMPLKWYHTEQHKRSLDTPVPLFSIVAAVQGAIRVGAKVINMSIDGNEPFAPERLALQRALWLGIAVVVAAGNDGLDLSLACASYPACYRFKSDKFHVVAGKDAGGMLAEKSNWGGPVNAVERNDNDLDAGTSVAAAIHSAKVAMGCSKNSCSVRR